MKGISTVGILMLTVFLSLSVPAHAGTSTPYLIYGYVNYSDGAPADDALVTIYRAGDPLNNTTAVVGSSYGVSGWWKGDLYNIPPRGITTVGSGDNITVEVADDESNTGVATLVVDTSIMGAHRVADVTISTSQDTTPPTITDNTPTGTDVPISTVISVTFDEAMNQASAEGAFFIDPPVAGLFRWDGDTMIFDPDDDLAYGTTYNVTIGTVAEDLAGNPLADDFTWGFTTESAPAYPAPSITDWSNDKTNDNSPSITVNESEAVRFTATADQTIDTWNWYKDGADQSQNFDNYTTSWSVNGTYSVSVNATNANGTSNMIAWTITVNDITPPAQVTGLTNDTPTTATVNLSWNANTEGDLAGYRVYQDGSLLGSTANTYYNVAGLLASTTYEFNVSAYDDNGLEGENASVTVTTAAYPAPSIIGYAPSSPVLDIECLSRTFNITIDQTVNVTWLINGTVQMNENVTGVTVASYTNTSAVPGFWNVSAVAENVNGTAMQTWIWNVAETNNTYVPGNETFTVTSGVATIIGNFDINVAGWVNVTAIPNATASPEVNDSNPHYGLGSDDKVVSGVIVNVSDSINSNLTAAGNGTIRIQICYTTLDPDIDPDTLAIWKYNSSTETWEKQQPSIIDGTCVYADVNHLCTFALAGSKPSPSTGRRGGGGDGTYPPGWFETPTPTPTETPTAPAPTEVEPSVTPPAEEETLTPAAEGEATAEGTEPTTELKTPGFEAVFMIAGLLAVAYLVLRRRE